jgi:hypothetical protein
MSGKLARRKDPPANPEPDPSPSDMHVMPLDDEEDGRYLERGDLRRVAAERLRGRSFDEDD